MAVDIFEDGFLSKYCEAVVAEARRLHPDELELLDLVNRHGVNVQHLDPADRQRLIGVLTDVEASIKTSKARKILVSEMADAADMTDWYLTLYGINSTAVHTNVRELIHHLVLDDEGRLVELKNEPRLDRLGDQVLQVRLREPVPARGVRRRD